MAEKSIIDLSVLEYEEFRKLFRELIPQYTPFWTDYSDTDPGIVILDIIAAIADQFHFYLDRRVNEAFITRAVSKKSILDLAKILDFRLKRIASPKIKVKFVYDGEVSEDIYFPTYVQILSDTGVPYVVVGPHVLRVGYNSIEVEAYQGLLIHESFTSDGKDIQKYVLSGQNIDENVFDVYVNNERWVEDKCFPVLVDREKVYQVEVDDKGVVSLRFDAYRYSVPSEGDTIDVYYNSTLGPLGSVNERAKFTIQTLEGDTSWVNNVGNFSVEAISDAVGGALEEDYRKVKYLLPRYFSALWRAVTLRDYVTIALSFPGVRFARASVDPYNRWVVKLYVKAINEGDFYLFAEDLEEYFKDFCPMGVTLEVEPFSEVAIDIRLEISVLQGVSVFEVNTKVNEALHSFFEESALSGSNVILLNDLYSVLDSIRGINSLKVVRFCRQGEDTVDHIYLKDFELATPGDVSVSFVR